MLGWRICRNAALAKDWWPCCPLSDQPGHREARAAMTRGRKRNKRSGCPILRTELNQSLHGEQPVLLQTLCSAQGSSHGHTCVFTTPPAPSRPALPHTAWPGTHSTHPASPPPSVPPVPRSPLSPTQGGRRGARRDLLSPLRGRLPLLPQGLEEANYSSQHPPRSASP